MIKMLHSSLNHIHEEDSEMNKMMIYVVVLWMTLAASTSQAKDVYDWRAKTEWICAMSFRILEQQIPANMAGGRPEKSVVDKLNDAVPTIQDMCETDPATAEIAVKSLVHSFFTDPELRLPIYTVRSVQKARMKCSANIIRNDPDGSKTEAYKRLKAEEQRKKDEQDELQTMEIEKRQQEEERAQLEKNKKQQEEAVAKAAEDARVRQEEDNARQEEQRRLKAEEDARMERDAEKRRAEVAERQRQQDAIIQNMLR